MKTKDLPGYLWIKKTRWYWQVRLPGDSKRRTYTLSVPSSKPKRDAAAAALRLWRSRSPAAADADRQTDDALVSEVVAAYIDYLYKVYSPKMSSDIARAVSLLLGPFGTKPVTDIVHRDLVRCRESLVAKGLCVTTINQYVGCWRRMWAWALDAGLISATTKYELTQISNLRPGRSPARPPKIVGAARHYAVKAVCSLLPPSLADMIRVQELSGMRTGELCSMRWCEIDRRSSVWIYRPSAHKNSARGLPRAIVLGPRAVSILRAYAPRNMAEEGDFVFSPHRAMFERRIAMRAARKTPVQPSQLDRSKPLPIRAPGESWDSQAFGKAILNCCERAIEDGLVDEGDVFTSTMLRHACATRVRRWFGIEAARAVLGHSWGRLSAITDRYSRDAIEGEMIRGARPAMIALG